MPVADNLLSHIPAFRSLRAAHYSENFSVFARAAWSVVFPGRALVWSPAYDLLCELLVAIKARDARYLRTIWNQPPRTGKSYFCSIAWPVWTWLTQPEHTFVFASYSMDLSVEHSVARRNLIQSQWFQRLFADRFQLSSDRNLTSQFSNDHRGQMFATSAGARLMGFGFDTCVADDLTSADMALSDSERTSANNWFDHTLRQRANDPSSSSILVISQRTHELDVPGFLLESEPGTWNHISIPLIAEEPHEYVLPSGRVWKRPSGDVLQPKRFTPKVVEELQKRRLVYSGQYQQAPIPLEGNLVKLADLMFYGGATDEPLPERFDTKLISVDCAFKNYNDNDMTCVLVVGVSGRRRFVLDCVNAHLDVGQMERVIQDMHRRWSPVSTCLIEEAASGVAVLQRVRVNAMPGVIGVVPKGGKASRMMAASPEFQAHDWYFPRHKMEAEITQLISFPRSRRDDFCDAVSQAAIWLQEHPFQGEGAPVAVLRQDRIGAAAALAHVPSGYERGTAAQGGWNVSPEVGRKMTDGRGFLDMTSDEIDQVLFGNLEGE